MSLCVLSCVLFMKLNLLFEFGCARLILFYHSTPGDAHVSDCGRKQRKTHTANGRPCKPYTEEPSCWRTKESGRLLVHHHCECVRFPVQHIWKRVNEPMKVGFAEDLFILSARHV